MLKGFVFGKFLPFHKGHEAMIRFAASQCDRLTVLACCSDQEKLPCAVRKKWIEQAFVGQPHIEVRTYPYLESDLPNTSVSSETVSKVWADIFKGLFPDYGLLVTSESYGDYVASFMGIRHVAFDAPRQSVPVSATAIRNDLAGYWGFLPDSVKADMAIKVVLLGTESTGKSTLAEKLATHYGCSWVPEAARDIIADSRSFTPADLARTAAEHARRIGQALIGDSPLVVIDTDIHVTESYAAFVFEQTLDVDSSLYAINKAHLYLYLNNDVPYWQDGTRLSLPDRDALDQSHRSVLHRRGISYVEVSGDWEARFRQAVGQIDALLVSANQVAWR